MELRIITPDEAFLKAVEFNHEEIKQELALRLEKYMGLQYTDEQIKEAKTDRATLNKFKEALENKRKEVKALCLEPYEKFEARIKEIVAMVEQPISEIDKQVKGYEDKQKEEKKLVIEGVYAESIGDLKEILSLKRLWNDKWLNATYKLSNITEEIVKAIEKTASDLVVIGQLQSEYELQIKDKYLQNLDLSAALAEKTRLEEQAKKLTEYEAEQHRKKLEEAERRIQEEKLRQAKIAAVTPVVKEVVPVQPEVLAYKAQMELVGAGAAATEESPVETLDFRVWVTKEQKLALRDFLIANNIKYGRVE